MLKELAGQWAAGNFSALPPIVLLPGSSMPGAAGAYAISTGTIYLNMDWLASASQNWVIAVLTEELGHHLDGLLNKKDSPGDEGKIFAMMIQIKNATNSQPLRKVYDHSSLVLGATNLAVEQAALWARPIGSARITQRFDSTIIDYNDDGIKDKHRGIDFAAPAGSPVYASRAGTVELLPNNGMYGNRINVNHGDGYFSVYAHLREFTVSNGAYVLQGQQIGKVGSTGFSSGPHLHFEIRIGSQKIDPEPLINGTTPPLNPPPPESDGRLDLPIFDPSYYLATYADVRNAYGTANYEGAKSHWLQFGISEGRRGSLVFDPKYYLKTYQDVANAYGASNYAGAISHWLQYGLKDGRRGSQEFDPIYYMAAHPDVEQAYGTKNFSGAISHFYQWGKPGGWFGSEWITDSTAYQLWYYLANNPDVKAVTNNSNQEVEATRHWYFIGINEGRRGSAELDAKFYLANNEDVRNAYGSENYRGAIDHYLLYGKAGGRSGADDRPRTLTISDASIAEGNGGSQVLSFKVTLNIVCGETVEVDYSTSDTSATSGSDYSATNPLSQESCRPGFFTAGGMRR